MFCIIKNSLRQNSDFLYYINSVVSELYFCQISRNSDDWIGRNRRVSAKAVGLGSFGKKKKKIRIAGFFASLPFLIYLGDKRLKPSIHCVQLQRKIALRQCGFEANIMIALMTACLFFFFFFQSLCARRIASPKARALNCISKSVRENCVRQP